MAQGADVLIGHGKGAVWNTAVAVNLPNAGLLLNDWTIGNGLGPLVYSASLTGSGGRSNAIRGLNKLTGDVTTELRYSGIEHMLAMIMGIAGVPTTLDGTARKHVFQLSPNVDGLFDTIAVMKVGPAPAPALPIWEYPSAKFGGMTLTLTADGLAMMTVPVIASSCKPLTGQTNTTLAAVTYRTKGLNVFGTHIKFRANPATGAALTDTDRFYPSQLTFTFTRNLDSSYVMDGSGIQPEPYYTDFYQVSTSLVFPVYGAGNLQANNTFMSNAFNEIPMKMDVVMTSPQLAGAATERYSILLEAPNVVIGDSQMPVNDAGAIPVNVEMAMLDTAVAPAGMTTPPLTKHFRITVVSQFNTDAILNP